MYDLDAANFTVEISILTTKQGGRVNPPFNNIRWDFRYENDDTSKAYLYDLALFFG